VDVKVSVEREYWWVPEFEGNAKDPKPIRFRKRMLTGGERVRYISPRSSGEGMDAEGIFEASVLEVEGLTLGGKAATTAREVLKYSELYLLIIESVGETLRHAGGPDLKNSGSPSPG